MNRKDFKKNCSLSVNNKVTIFGKLEHCENAKQLLIDNIPTTIAIS
jgi:hypothetical protein